MPEDEVKKILDDLEKHGFPLEVEASEILKAHKWEVTNQAAYIDLQEKKFRTVDIVAEKNVSVTPGFDLWLVIECKKSTKPWVFYASDFDLDNPETRRKAVSSSQFFISSLAYQKKSHEEIISIMESFFLKKHLTSGTFDKLGYIPYEAFTDGGGRNIHKAQMQVCNAILDLNARIEQEMRISVPYGIIFMPIIVLDGHLYAYKDEKLDAEDGIYYHVSYADSTFMIEIVVCDFLDKYLNTIDSEIEYFQRK